MEKCFTDLQKFKCFSLLSNLFVKTKRYNFFAVKMMRKNQVLEHYSPKVVFAVKKNIKLGICYFM